MTAPELLRAIRAHGGTLELLPDGRLRCRRIPAELRPELEARADKVKAYLRELLGPEIFGDELATIDRLRLLVHEHWGIPLEAMVDPAGVFEAIDRRWQGHRQEVH